MDIKEQNPLYLPAGEFTFGQSDGTSNRIGGDVDLLLSNTPAEMDMMRSFMLQFAEEMGLATP